MYVDDSRFVLNVNNYQFHNLLDVHWQPRSTEYDRSLRDILRIPKR